MARPVHLLCAGAAKGLVLALQGEFERSRDAELVSSFGAVGALREQLDAGAPCEAIVLTRTLIDSLAREGRVDAASVRDLGAVDTGVAVLHAAPAAVVSDTDALQSLLQRASAIYVPDPQRATAGIHALRVLRELGQAQPERLRAHPNGAAAMAALARDGDPLAVGITQVSEILYTPGLRLLGALPSPFALATLYSAAVVRGTAQPEAAADLLALLAAPAQAATRRRCGFEPV
ncbi:MAG TPA: substrate-binding domain-containing protein [Burkholderiaceae bacterium]|nr:substrate-binding domain-containing protein [Burkholderiaceae bacterium]